LGGGEVGKVIGSMELALATFYFFISIEAINVTDWGRKSNYLYSTDCIWFNALAGFIYLIIGSALFCL
jgi:hypothetical protein